MYIDQLDEIVNKYNNTYHNTLEMRSVDVKSNLCIDSSKEINDKVGDIVRMSKYKNSFAKGYVSNWSEDVY